VKLNRRLLYNFHALKVLWRENKDLSPSQTRRLRPSTVDHHSPHSLKRIGSRSSSGITHVLRSMGSGSTSCSRCQEGPLHGAAKNILTSAGSSGVPLGGKFLTLGGKKNSYNGTITWSLIRICLFYLKRGRVHEQGLWWLPLSPFVEFAPRRRQLGVLLRRIQTRSEDRGDESQYVDISFATRLRQWTGLFEASWFGSVRVKVYLRKYSLTKSVASVNGDGC
jgi:hypothetical protein